MTPLAHYLQVCSGGPSAFYWFVYPWMPSEPASLTMAHEFLTSFLFVGVHMSFRWHLYARRTPYTCTMAA
jgi:hypothetical protein